MSAKNEIDAERRRAVDGSQLVRQLGVDSQEIQWRKEYSNFDQRDRQRIETVGDVVEPHFDALLSDFYSHLKTFDETVAIFGRSTKTFDHLREDQRAYLSQLFGGEYDQQYFESRARIGRIHDMLDLGPKIYLGAYNVFYEHMVDALVADIKDQLEADGSADDALEPADALDQLGENLLSVFKIMNLDQQIVMDTYIHSYSQDIQRELDRQQSVSNTVHDASREAKEAGKQITQTADEISDAATSQAESVGQVASEVSNMSATVEEIASTADEVATQSRQADDLAQEGTEAADQARSVMDAVADSSEEVVEDMDDLQSRIDDIDEVVEVINEIAEQTNLLALNASIEAARAGEAGEGFAVVADEVKHLAEESQTHASDIEHLIDEIQTDASSTVTSLEETTKKVDAGIQQVEAAMETLEHIADAVQGVSQGIQEVSDASDDQAASSEEVASMVSELVDQADHVADKIEDIAAANEQQTEQIHEIEETVAQLT